MTHLGTDATTLPTDSTALPRPAEIAVDTSHFYISFEDANLGENEQPAEQPGEEVEQPEHAEDRELQGAYAQFETAYEETRAIYELIENIYTYYSTSRRAIERSVQDMLSQAPFNISKETNQEFLNEFDRLSYYLQENWPGEWSIDEFHLHLDACSSAIMRTTDSIQGIDDAMNRFDPEKTAQITENPAEIMRVAQERLLEIRQTYEEHIYTFLEQRDERNTWMTEKLFALARAMTQRYARDIAQYASDISEKIGKITQKIEPLLQSSEIRWKFQILSRVIDPHLPEELRREVRSYIKDRLTDKLADALSKIETEDLAPTPSAYVFFYQRIQQLLEEKKVTEQEDEQALQASKADYTVLQPYLSVQSHNLINSAKEKLEKSLEENRQKQSQLLKRRNNAGQMMINALENYQEKIAEETEKIVNGGMSDREFQAFLAFADEHITGVTPWLARLEDLAEKLARRTIDEYPGQTAAVFQPGIPPDRPQAASQAATSLRGARALVDYLNKLAGYIEQRLEYITEQYRTYEAREGWEPLDSEDDYSSFYNY